MQFGNDVTDEHVCGFSKIFFRSMVVIAIIYFLKKIVCSHMALFDASSLVLSVPNTEMQFLCWNGDAMFTLCEGELSHIPTALFMQVFQYLHMRFRFSFGLFEWH